MHASDSTTVGRSVSCPACQHEFDVELWRIVDSEKSPEAAAALLTADLCRPRCPHCGEPMLLEYPLVYVNPELALVVELAPAGGARADRAELSQTAALVVQYYDCLLYTSPSPRDTR